MIIGPAIDEAAEYYMEPQLIGASATRSAHNVLSHANPISGLDKVWKIDDIPLKRGVEYGGWVVRWPNFDVESKGSDAAGKIFQNYERVIDKQIEKANNIDIFLKWRNTKLSFYRMITN
jgi:hypothetical protein